MIEKLTFPKREHRKNAFILIATEKKLFSGVEQRYTCAFMNIMTDGDLKEGSCVALREKISKGVSI